MFDAHDITALTMYGDTGVSLSDEMKFLKSAHLFYLKLHGNFDGNLDEARAHAFSATKGDLGLLSTYCVTASSANMFKNKVDTNLRRMDYT